jgi:hypothetical protein
MNTLKQQAEKMNLYMFEDIPSAWKEDKENFEHKVKCEAQDIPEFLLTASGYECGLFYNCRTQDKGTEKERKYIDHSYILVKKSDSDLILLLAKDWRTKKYRFLPYYDEMLKYRNLSSYAKEEANKLKEPNFIGTFTLNKLNAWHNHCIQYMQTLEKIYQANNNKNSEIENKIQSFLDSIKGANVSTYHDKTWIETDLFAVHFNHHKSEGYLNTKIEYKGGLEKVAQIINLMK